MPAQPSTVPRPVSRTGAARALLAAVAVLLAPAAGAARALQEPSPADVPAADGGAPFLTLAVTLLVFLLVVGLAWFGTRWLTRRLWGVPGTGAGRIRVLERVPLEPRRTLYLVEIGSRILLIGAGDRDLRVLAEMDRAALPEPPPAERRSFAETLRRLAGRGNGGSG
jgi:flagellar biogenesis protein FliO